MADSRKKIGRYTLFDRIAEGGTAEVYRGTIETKDGSPRRLVAIKCIHGERVDDLNFLGFLREETQVCKALCHPNVVQTLDCGEEDGRPFIVLEYVNGASLKQISDRMGELSKPVPVELATFIVEQAAGALHYGHQFADPATGRTLNIIHRDVSPHNILVSYGGVPKLIDFGIAKVLQRGDKTKAGLIKGKPAYLSPEQALGKPVDARSDIFALGIVLWETLTGRSLFGGLERMAILRAVADEGVVIVAPSMINPSVPETLDAIVLRALERDPEKRFRTAHELQVALHQTLTSKSREHYFRELSALLARIFPEEIKRENEELARLGVVVQALTGSSVRDQTYLIPAIMPAVSRGGLSSQEVKLVWPPLPRSRKQARERTAGSAQAQPQTRKPRSLRIGRPPAPKPWQTVAAALLAAFGAIGFFTYLRQRGQQPPPPVPVAAEPAPPVAVVPPPVTRAPASSRKSAKKKAFDKKSPRAKSPKRERTKR